LHSLAAAAGESMITLLICGSRAATPEMIDYARRCVVRAKKRGYIVIVGDAEGVDAAVMDECQRLDVPHIIVGGYSKIRRRTKNGSLYAHEGDYLARDRHMVDQCNIAIGVWNGVSRGTKYTIDYAKRMQKEAHLVNFGAK
jgi:hypothetical protein